MHIGLKVRDIEESLAFYRDFMDCECSEVIECESIGKRLAFCHAPTGGVVELIESKDECGFDHIAIEIPKGHYDRVKNDARVSGMRIVQELVIPEIGIRCFFAERNSGEVLEFMEKLEG